MKFLEKPFELLEGKSLDGFLILGPYASGFVVVSMWFLVNHRPYLDHTWIIPGPYLYLDHTWTIPGPYLVVPLGVW